MSLKELIDKHLNEEFHDMVVSHKQEKAKMMFDMQVHIFTLKNGGEVLVYESEK